MCVQANVKRLLAYSSIAHAGYLAIVWLGFSNLGISAGVFYIAAYLFMNTGAFAIVVWLSKGQREGDTLEDFAGLFYRRPWLAAAMTLFMLSLAGFPTTAGFAGKIFLVSSAMASGMGSVGTWLVGLLAATSAISAYAYVRVIVAMFKGERASGALRLRSPSVRLRLHPRKSRRANPDPCLRSRTQPASAPRGLFHSSSSYQSQGPCTLVWPLNRSLLWQASCCRFSSGRGRFDSGFERPHVAAWPLIGAICRVVIRDQTSKKRGWMLWTRFLFGSRSSWTTLRI